MSAHSDASVSVVIPCYNAGRFVTQALDSVLVQSIRPQEILVINDGSTDNSEALLRPYFDKIRYIAQSNQGVSASRNRGVREATGEFVAFLDADDVWHPQKLELQLAVLRQQPEIGLLGTQIFSWPATTFPNIAAQERLAVAPVTWKQLVVKNRLITSSVVVQKKRLDQAGPFDTHLQGPEDRDLWLRVGELAPLGNLPLPLTGYRDVEGSVSKQVARCEAGMLAIVRKLEVRGALKGHRWLRRKAYSYINHSCACIYSQAGNHREALTRSLRTLAWYPLPYRRDEVESHLERPKRLLVNLLRVARLRGAPPRCANHWEEGTADALQTFLARSRDACVS